MDVERLGLFYLGRRYDPDAHAPTDEPLLYDSTHLLTHAVCIGMTGSGKTGLGVALLEEAAIDGIPAIAIDPKGDLANLCLTFPSLAPADFAPWTRGQGADPGVEAQRWRDGLAAWGQDGARVARLRASADVRVYTPGSRAGLPLRMLGSLGPPAVVDDPELLGARAESVAASLTSLAGVGGEAASRENVLLANILLDAWRRTRTLDLGGLLAEVQKPSFARIGVLDLEAFYPAADRFALVMKLNTVLAAPGFAAWLEGEPLEIGSLLHGPDGKPRIAIVSVAHLDDAQRMSVVALVLEQTLAWVRTQRGTTSLRAVLYMDELFGFLPPTAMPPSKRPLLTLLKQARAFGLGCVLATQNPVDLDYKALGNAGTWFLGRLQTERDKARVLDGLESAAPSGLDRPKLDALLSTLDKRVFLLHDVHAPAPALFQTRFTLSYLRGPMDRDEIRALMDPLRTAAAPALPVVPAAAPAPAPAESATAPVLPPDVPQFFAPGEGARWAPALLGALRVGWVDAVRGVDVTRDVVVWTPIEDGPIAVDWAKATEAPVAVDGLRAAPERARPFAPLPAAAAKAKSYAAWTKELVQWAGRAQTLELLRSARAELVSAPGETEGAFRVRVVHALRERRDEALARVQATYAPKLAKLDEQKRRAAQKVERQADQAHEQKFSTAVSVGATVLGALFGRSAIGRAATAARGVRRMAREDKEVARAQADVTVLDARKRELEAALEADLAAVQAAWAGDGGALETVSVKPKKGAVEARRVALVWRPE